MSKKMQNIEAPSVRSGQSEGMTSSNIRSVEAKDRERENRIFSLYLARIATIDRYRVPITDKGLVSAYRKALDEAMVAMSVFDEGV